MIYILKMVNITAIIQARLGSCRLPNKVLMDINSYPMIYYTLYRVSQSKLINKTILATSSNKDNSKLEEFCNNYNFNFYKSDNDIDENDVLSRFYKCALLHKSDIIIRITGDCPLIDPDIIDNMIQYYLNNQDKYDIIINTWFNNSYPSGFDAEVFNLETLKKQHFLEQDMHRREHVMNTLTNDNFRVKKYSILDKNFINNLSFEYNLIHLSVDTEEDFIVVSKIITTLGGLNFSFNDIINYLENNPYLLQINYDKNRILEIKNIKS